MWDCGAVVVCRVLWCGIIGVSVSMKGKIKMFKVNAYVTEIEPDNFYAVDIDGLFKTTVADCGDIDGSVVSFESALTTVLEIMYGDCFDFVRLRSDKVNCRTYLVTIEDEVE